MLKDHSLEQQQLSKAAIIEKKFIKSIEQVNGEELLQRIQKIFRLRYFVQGNFKRKIRGKNICDEELLWGTSQKS